MNQETLAAISAIVGVIGAVGSVFAALAAFRSAGIAKLAVDQSIKSERKRTVDNAVQTAQRVIVEHDRLVDLAARLKAEYKTLFAFAGGGDSSRLKMRTARVEQAETEIAPFKQSAEEWLSTDSENADPSIENTEQKLREFEGYVVRIEAAKEGLKEDLASVQQQNHTFRERALNRRP